MVRCVSDLPCEFPEYVPPSEKGDFEYSDEAIRLANTAGEIL
jgi:hypothetical protein